MRCKHCASESQVAKKYENKIQQIRNSVYSITVFRYIRIEIRTPAIQKIHIVRIKQPNVLTHSIRIKKI